MLYIEFSENEKEIRYTESYFNNNYQDEWMEDPQVKQIIRDIDSSKLLNPQIVMSPVLGAIPVIQISGGAKAVILMLKMPHLLIHGNSCGDNCAVLPELNWELNLSALAGTIIFIDENHPALAQGHRLASLMAQSDNCYIIISRDKMSWIPYSYLEIYEIRTSGKYHFLTPVYQKIPSLPAGIL